MDSAKQFDVFLDGSCTFCKWTRSKVGPYDTHSRLRFLDYNDPAIAAEAPFSRSELADEMHVRTPGGRWVKGYEAWISLLRVLPKLAWLGWIGGLPLVRWFGPSLYRFVARHRYLLPGAPAPCKEDSCAVPSRTAK